MENNERIGLIGLIGPINKIIVLLIALGAPLTLLPLQGHWGFERSVLLIAVFLGLIAWRVVTSVSVAGEISERGSEIQDKRASLLTPATRKVVLLTAAALPVAAFLSAPAPDVRWVHLASLELWAAVGGILTVLVLPISGRSSENSRASLLITALGVLIATIGLIRPAGPIGPIKQGLDYQASLGITSATLQKEPLWGVGPHKFGESFLRFKTTDFNSRDDWILRYNGSRSGLLELAVEYGLIGLIGPIGLIGLILAELQRKRKQLSKVELYLRAGLLGVAVAAFVFLPYSPGVFWVLGVLANRSCKTNKTNTDD